MNVKIYIMNERINKRYEWSQALGREVETTSYADEFFNDIAKYRRKARELKEDIERVSNNYYFNGVDFAIRFLKEFKAKSNEVNSLYINLLEEIKRSKCANEFLTKKRIPKLNGVKYYDTEAKKVKELINY